jgi:hypothetical protein
MLALTPHFARLFVTAPARSQPCSVSDSEHFSHTFSCSRRCGQAWPFRPPASWRRAGIFCSRFFPAPPKFETHPARSRLPGRCSCACDSRGEMLFLGRHGNSTPCAEDSAHFRIFEPHCPTQTGNLNKDFDGFYVQWTEPGSNRRPKDFQSFALPAELSVLMVARKAFCKPSESRPPGRMRFHPPAATALF